jgi:hypothetical protein
MIEDTIAEIEKRLKNAGSVDDIRKSELLSLLGNLKSEIASLSRTHQDEARSIAGLAQISADNAIREQRDPEQVQTSLDELAASVTGFENSHPTLVQVVNRICTTLSNLGI